tara:strand:- start:193 stop:957 length:765 start_codon:yes stop_codon:yes gene_type:complete
MDNIPVERDSMDTKDSIISSILENAPAQMQIEVKLPSLCLPYKNYDANLPVMLRPMTFEDEKLIASVQESDSSEDPLNAILARCTLNLPIHELLLIDKVYLILKLREISYGDEFQADVTCIKCHKETPVKFDLKNLPVIYFPEDMQIPKEIDLPVIQKKAKVRFPTIADEKVLSDGGAALAQLWRFIVEIDGHSNKGIISEVISKLPIKDAHTIINAISGAEFGVQTKVKFQCFQCRENATIDLPIGPGFFTVS